MDFWGSMEPDFWYQRWQKKEIGFHKDQPNIYLKRHWESLNTPAESRVFVPLCGKSLDMVWLTQQGHKVLGVELSEVAVREFFESLDVSPEVTEIEDFTHFRSESISIYCGDIFSLKASHLSEVQAVYDRGALVALPPEMRKSYAKHLSLHLPISVNGLLITFDYDENLLQGPPFSVPEKEVLNLFGTDNDVTQLASDTMMFRDENVQIEIWKYMRK